jgi:hypothetical protein
MAVQDRPQLLQARPPKVSTNECPAIVVIAPPLLLRCRAAFRNLDLQKVRRVAEAESEAGRPAGCCRSERRGYPTLPGPALLRRWREISAAAHKALARAPALGGDVQCLLDH